jgi:hypothetical protein
MVVKGDKQEAQIMQAEEVAVLVQQVAMRVLLEEQVVLEVTPIQVGLVLHQLEWVDIMQAGVEAEQTIKLHLQVDKMAVVMAVVIMAAALQQLMEHNLVAAAVEVVEINQVLFMVAVAVQELQLLDI